MRRSERHEGRIRREEGMSSRGTRWRGESRRRQVSEHSNPSPPLISVTFPCLLWCCRQPWDSRPVCLLNVPTLGWRMLTGKRDWSSWGMDGSTKRRTGESVSEPGWRKARDGMGLNYDFGKQRPPSLSHFPPVYTIQSAPPPPQKTAAYLINIHSAFLVLESPCTHTYTPWRPVMDSVCINC